MFTRATFKVQKATKIQKIDIEYWVTPWKHIACRKTTTMSKTIASREQKKGKEDGFFWCGADNPICTLNICDERNNINSHFDSILLQHKKGNLKTGKKSVIIWMKETKWKEANKKANSFQPITRTHSANNDIAQHTQKIIFFSRVSHFEWDFGVIIANGVTVLFAFVHAYQRAFASNSKILITKEYVFHFKLKLKLKKKTVKKTHTNAQILKASTENCVRHLFCHKKRMSPVGGWVVRPRKYDTLSRILV